MVPIGIELNPVPWFVVKMALAPASTKELDDAYARLEKRIVPWSGKTVAETLSSLYQTQPPFISSAGDSATAVSPSHTIHTFWVKSAVCTIPTCKKLVSLFTDYIVAKKAPSIRYHADCTCPNCDRKFDWDVEPAAMVSHRSLLNRVMVRRTKREVVDANGKALFVRRQVHTEAFEPALREQRFYEQLTGYLRTGYEAAGVFRAGRTTSAQRAIGFVMTAFQKMMSSSPRAIKQALRRRLLVLLVREQIEVERKRRTNFEPELAPHIVRLQDEMRILAREIMLTSGTTIHDAEADTYIAQVRQRIVRKLADLEETTEWSLDSDEEGDEGVYANAEIPDESSRVRELVSLVPEGTDRKFDRLLSVISGLRGVNEGERFIIFTQYRETLEFLRIELAKIYGAGRWTTRLKPPSGFGMRTARNS